MRRAAPGLCLFLTACGFRVGSATSEDAAVHDATVDAASDAAFDAGLDAPPVDCIARWHAGTVTFQPAVALATVNSGSSDRDPTISADELTLHLNSDRPGSMGGDIWASTRGAVTEAFSAPVLVPSLNSPTSETRVSFTSNGLLAVLGSSRSGGAGGTDVWIAQRASTVTPWLPPTQTGLAAVNDGNSQHDPLLSGDGLRLYFAPTTGGQHLEIATRANLVAAWGAPTEVTPPGNGDADPTLSPDETVLVFASNRAPSQGDDIWYMTRTNASVAFGSPTRIVGSVNSSANDADPSLSADGCRLYFGSTRANGDWDLYVASLAP